jgi:enhancing lycopene biosynthesis protein 2
MKIGVLLSGCGVYDGAEIQESVLTLLAIAEAGHESVCISINDNQHHVINHLSGEEMNEKRNMLIESARIARGNVTEISKISPADIDALVIPGGFGSAKNFTSWAFDGPKGTIRPDVKLLIVNLINIGKPIVALCVSPVVLSKALEGSAIKLNLTIGSTKSPSPYSISDFMDGIKTTGASTSERELHEILIDSENKVISAPCYMMEATILEIRQNIKQAIDALNQF